MHLVVLSFAMQSCDNADSGLSNGPDRATSVHQTSATSTSEPSQAANPEARIALERPRAGEGDPSSNPLLGQQPTDEVDRVQSAMDAAKCVNRLRMIGLALNNYKKAFGRWPGTLAKKSPNQQSSWCVDLLPFLGYKTIYDSIDRKAKWNTAHNLAVWRNHPDLYNCPASKSPGATAYALLVDPDVRLSTPSHPNTKIVLVEMPPQDTPWIAPPGSNAVDLVKQLRRQASPGHNGKFHVLFDDGNVELVDAHHLVDAIDRPRPADSK
jgi:hypothetical protein